MAAAWERALDVKDGTSEGFVNREECALIEDVARTESVLRACIERLNGMLFGQSSMSIECTEVVMAADAEIVAMFDPRTNDPYMAEITGFAQRALLELLKYGYVVWSTHPDTHRTKRPRVRVAPVGTFTLQRTYDKESGDAVYTAAGATGEEELRVYMVEHMAPTHDGRHTSLVASLLGDILHARALREAELVAVLHNTTPTLTVENHDHQRDGIGANGITMSALSAGPEAADQMARDLVVIDGIKRQRMAEALEQAQDSLDHGRVKPRFNVSTGRTEDRRDVTHIRLLPMPSGYRLTSPAPYPVPANAIEFSNYKDAMICAVMGISPGLVIGQSVTRDNAETFTKNAIEQSKLLRRIIADMVAHVLTEAFWPAVREHVKSEPDADKITRFNELSERTMARRELSFRVDFAPVVTANLRGIEYLVYRGFISRETEARFLAASLGVPITDIIVPTGEGVGGEEEQGEKTLFPRLKKRLRQKAAGPVVGTRELRDVE